MKDYEYLKDMALLMAVKCVRNTVLEKYHEGRFPQSKTGDYSDVYVVTPEGKIPWNEVSRIRNSEMMELNKEVVNNLYTFLSLYLNPEYAHLREVWLKQIGELFPYHWDSPELKEEHIEWLRKKFEEQK